MRRLITATVSLIALALTGCASTGMTEQGEVAYYQAQADAAKRPMVQLDCPESGCWVSGLTVHNPNDRGVQAAPVRSPGVELGKALIGAATSMAPWYATSAIAIEGMQAIRDAGAGGDVTSTTTSTTTITTAERGDTFGDAATVVGGDQVGDNSGASSGNSGRIESPSTVTDATHDPVVVP